MPISFDYSCRGGEPFTSTDPRGVRQARGTSDDPVMAALARADSTPQRDGLLKKTIVCPETGRKTYEFELLPGQTKSSTWFVPYAAQPQEQLFINDKALGADDRKAKQNKILADRAFMEQVARDLAAGKDVRFTDFESGERMS